MGLFNRLFAGKSGKQSAEAHEYAEGDVFYTQKDGQYATYKLLVIDNETDTWHVLVYGRLSSAPTESSLDQLGVAIYHVPIARSGFIDPVFVASTILTANDLTGYHEYLRQTQPFEYYASIATNYYNSAHRLTNEKKIDEAILAYSKAIDLIPSFFEAIDNRAFCKMMQGRWEDALADFRHSLEIEPNSLLAEISIGECYLRLGRYAEAKAQFEKAMKIDPAHEAPKEFLKKVDALIGKQNT